MKYCLSRNWCFRGYIATPYVLVDIYSHKYQLLTQKVFSLLLLCDGQFEFDGTIVTDEEIKVLEFFDSLGIIEKVSDGHFLHEEQKYYFYNNRFVPYVHWSITRKCNFNCRHCFMDSPVCSDVDLSFEECKNIIDQMVDCGVISVDITGGEPFVRSDFWEIIDYLVINNIGIDFIYTNGALLNQDILEEFKRRNLTPKFSVSFDGIGWHDWMRGVDGAEQMAMDALKLASDFGFYTNVEMCVFKGNLESIADSIERLAQIGVSDIKIAGVLNTDLWCKNSQGNILNNEDYLDYLINNINEIIDKSKGVSVLLSGLLSISSDNETVKFVAEKNCEEKSIHNYYLCDCIKHVAYISPEGKLLPCISMGMGDTTMFVSVFDKNLKNQFASGDYIDFITAKPVDLFSKNEECNNCEYKLRCLGGCRALALTIGRDKNIWGIDDAACLMYKGGYLDKAKQKLNLK